MKISELIVKFELFAPLSLQESYDNSGLIIGSSDEEIIGVLLCIDITEDIVNEAIAKNVNLIISHHPIIFNGLKKITGKNYLERTILLAIKNNVAIYAAHTNLDNAKDGVNAKIAEKLNLKRCRILAPMNISMLKLVTFVPLAYVEKVRNALFEAGAGSIGNYDSCSFNIEGSGTFRAKEGANPFVGKISELHFENEIRLELILPKTIAGKVVNRLLSVHPYEEVAYDLYSLANENQTVGAGIIGELDDAMGEMEFLESLKKTFNSEGVRYTKLQNKEVRKVAVCGGSGSFLLNNAIKAGADVFVSADFKYHQFFDAENKIIIADIGHYESEQYTKEIFYEFLTKNFTNFAIYLSEVNTNPINYL